MKRMMSRVAAALAALVVIAGFAGCSSAPAGWLADYEEAQQLASKSGKDMLLFFSSEDTDGVSTQLRTTIFDTKDFIDAASKDYVLVHLDYSDSRMAAVQVGEDATDEEKKAAEAAMPQLEKDITTAMNFSVAGGAMPVLLLTTPQGYVYGNIPYDAAVTTAEQFLSVLEGSKENRDKIRALVRAVDSSTGVAKLKAIDDLYEATDPAYSYLLSDFYGMGSELDPDNESGLRGKYAILDAYAKATEALFVGDADTAIQAMLAAVDDGFCSDVEKQELLYQAAYFCSLLGDNERMSTYLNQALEAAPDSEMAASIKTTIDAYNLANENAGVTAEGME